MPDSPSAPPAPLQRWCQQQFPSSEHLDLVSGDASFRCYFRLHLPDDSLIAVVAPPEHEDNEAFVSVRQLLADHGIPVPDLHDWEQQQGFMLLEDFGDQMLLPALTSESVHQHYDAAMDLLSAVQKVPADTLPEYAPRLETELRTMEEWFVRLLDVELDEQDIAILDKTYAPLIDSANEQPQVLVHRDYHSRNLMIKPDGSLGVIDFQDAVRGPCTYDLVSLLRDCYIEWPDEEVKRWALAFRDVSFPSVDDDQFLRWFDLMGLQRHIKVLGVFARLSLRDDKHGYLKDLPTVVGYTRRIAKRYACTRDFAQWFDARLMPKIVQQPWFSE